MVMARLDSLDHRAGRRDLAGHVGSLVYAVDGPADRRRVPTASPSRLAVAGITLYEQMQTSLQRSLPTKVRVGHRTASCFARPPVTKAQRGRASPSCPPLAVSGSPRRSSTASAPMPGSRRAPHSQGSSPAAIVPTATDVVAGGNLGVTYSTGDITQGAFGTITSVCNGLVRGFGHPFNLLGETDVRHVGRRDLVHPGGPRRGRRSRSPTSGRRSAPSTRTATSGSPGPLGVLPSGAVVRSVLSHGTALARARAW